MRVEVEEEMVGGERRRMGRCVLVRGGVRGEGGG